MLRQQADAPFENNVVGGRVVPVSPIQALAKLGAGYFANKEEGKVRQMEGEAAASKQAKIAEALRNFQESGDNGALINSGIPELQQVGVKNLTTPQKFGDRVQYDQNGKAFVVGDGRIKYLDGVEKGPDKKVVNGQVVDMSAAQPGQVIPPQAPWEYQQGAQGDVQMRPGVLRAKTQIAQAGANAGGMPMTIVQTEQGPMQVPSKGSPGAPVRAMPLLGPDGKPVAAPPKSTNLTEAQGNAALFGARAEEADKVIQGIGPDYQVTGLNVKRAAEDVPIVGGALGVAGNLALKPKTQQVEQAQRDFVNAVLRKESGAAIGASEFKNAQRQYFPQPGDSKEVIEQKAKNRRTAIQGLRVMSGPGARMMDEAKGKEASPGGFTYLGKE